MDDIYLNAFSNDLRESIKRRLDKSGRGYNDLEETIDRLTKQKEYLQIQLRKAGKEIKELKDDNKKLAQQIQDKNNIVGTLRGKGLV
jgi:chromosome segregation ATPase